ncbi:hypothetical protein ASPZODRAFT_55209 [Penicilliopsis zonata CBS 506.65]|uniref:Zn(2)-C6 fungal-type domain-containing protein n=1 Tax=Penicilliopsis zonata CBS 506.65 TaxID=1073090 RepID=A0A1L9STY6_9EURO|nr:hypothetical protein ASPZODRAFT_55209 [Penicilliopsis zonata CBS 506.65]OJJ50596.1 hypothetical protein ASPZODRAFT_55209 [Penicilliopsis zonata CBS 506.65]
MPAYPIRRRPRECKTCLPCRASKVRCDRNVPCGNCVKRGQPNSCTYGVPPPSLVTTTTTLPTRPNTTTTTTATVTSSVSFPHAHLPPHPPPPSAQSYYSSARSSLFLDGVSSAAVDPDTLHDTPDTVNLAQGEWDEICSKMVAMEQILASLQSLFDSHSRRDGMSSAAAAWDPRKDSRSPQAEGVYGANVLNTGAVHLGSRAALVDILNSAKTSEAIAQVLPKDDLLADLALGNEAASYPFVDLWSSDPLGFNLAAVVAVLPDDHKCRRFFGFYKDIGAVLYPVLYDVPAVELSMNRLLHNRMMAGGVYKPDATGLVKPFGMNLAFLSLLFALLASGCQLSDLPGSERELTSWVYISCSYQCLRMINYVSNPSMEVIQVLLIISNVLSYNMNAGASYTLLGMTERMCMVLGLHVDSTKFSRTEQDIRRRVWWAMAFQNSHFSLAYDRPSITMVSQPEIPYDRKSMPGCRSYFETLCRVVSLALEVMRSRMHPGHFHTRYHEIREYKQRLQRILAETTPHLRSREHCTTLAEHIERMELRLHSSYLVSVLCRVSLDPSAHMDEQRRALIREECLASLVGTIEAFVELHSISSHSSRSWISLQRTIASAFLLVATEQGQNHPQTWALIDKLERVLADHVHADGEAHHNNRTDSAKHLASSLRSLREVSAAFRARKPPPPPPQHSTPPHPPQHSTPPLHPPHTAPQPSLLPQSVVSPVSSAPLVPPVSISSVPSVPTTMFSPPSVLFPSPAATDGSPATTTAMVQPSIGEWEMRSILDQVSDVMRFPPIPGKTSPV